MIIKFLYVFLDFRKSFIFGKVSFGTGFHVDFWINFYIYFVFFDIFFYFLCRKNHLGSCLITFGFIRYAESHNPIIIVFSMILIFEKNSDINEFTRGDYHNSFISQVYDLDDYWIVGCDLFDYGVIIDDVVKFFLSLLIPDHMLICFIKTGELECIKEDVWRWQCHLDLFWLSLCCTVLWLWFGVWLEHQFEFVGLLEMFLKRFGLLLFEIAQENLYFLLQELAMLKLLDGSCPLKNLLWQVSDLVKGLLIDKILFLHLWNWFVFNCIYQVEKI